MLSSLSLRSVIRLLGTHERESSATGHASPFAGGSRQKTKNGHPPLAGRVHQHVLTLIMAPSTHSRHRSLDQESLGGSLGRAGVRKIAERFGVNASTVQRISAGM